MCTLTWSLGDDGYGIRFNRDELHTRSVETPPQFSRHTGVCVLAPTDPDSGGTWLFVNEHGLSCALLNDYGAPAVDLAEGAAATAWTSRGRLMLDCAPCRRLEDVGGVLLAAIRRTKPFHLLALQTPDSGTGTRAHGWHWDGRALRVGPTTATGLLTSSSFRTDDVLASRRRSYERLLASTPPEELEAALSAWHRTHDSARPAHSVLMKRADAATRSITEIRVAKSGVRLAYEVVHPAPEAAQVWEMPLA